MENKWSLWFGSSETFVKSKQFGGGGRLVHNLGKSFFIFLAAPTISCEIQSTLFCELVHEI